jgi:hypothetical protein
MKSTNEGPKMTLAKKTPDLKPRGRRRAPFSPWLQFLRWFLPWLLPWLAWFFLRVTFDAAIQVHSDATATTHAREK